MRRILYYCSGITIDKQCAEITIYDSCVNISEIVARPPFSPPLLPSRSLSTSLQVKIYGAKVKVDSILGVAEIEAAEKEKMKNKVDRIMAHGIDVFINRQLIYNYPEQLFSQGEALLVGL